MKTIFIQFSDAIRTNASDAVAKKMYGCVNYLNTILANPRQRVFSVEPHMASYIRRMQMEGNRVVFLSSIKAETTRLILAALRLPQEVVTLPSYQSIGYSTALMKMLGNVCSMYGVDGHDMEVISSREYLRSTCRRYGIHNSTAPTWIR